MKPLQDFQKTEIMEKLIFDLHGILDMSLENFLRHFGLVFLDSMIKQLESDSPSHRLLRTCCSSQYDKNEEGSIYTSKKEGSLGSKETPQK